MNRAPLPPDVRQLVVERLGQALAAVYRRELEKRSADVNSESSSAQMAAAHDQAKGDLQTQKQGVRTADTSTLPDTSDVVRAATSTA
jgi:hypothetical protein